jgi:hypothetical protein
VLDNTPGTPRYWQKKKYELIARLENLGAFQLFFTLSCADMRWNENFTTFLDNYELRYEYVNGLEACFVKSKLNTDLPETSLEEFMKQEQNKTKFEYVRSNVRDATINFNTRVQEFIKTTVTNKHTKMPVKYYNYRVEFQRRGAGHIHGTLWLDLELSKIVMNNSPEEREAMDVNDKDVLETGEYDGKRLQKVLERVKNEEVGIQHQDCNENCEKCHDLKTLTWMVDRFITCTLKDPSTRDIALSVQQHKHFPQSCKKRGTNCRFGAPWFPCMRTIIQVPPRIKYKKEKVSGEESDNDEDAEKEKKEAEEKEKEEKEIEQKIGDAKEIQNAVKAVIEDNELMAGIQQYRQDEIDKYLHHRKLVQQISIVLQEMKPIHKGMKPSQKKKILLVKIKKE